MISQASKTPWALDIEGDFAVIKTFHNDHPTGCIARFYRGDQRSRDDAKLAVMAVNSRPQLLDALADAESFIRGFEDDESQEGIAKLLGRIRAAISNAQGVLK